jgi:hypothetical protein
MGGISTLGSDAALLVGQPGLGELGPDWTVFRSLHPTRHQVPGADLKAWTGQVTVRDGHVRRDGRLRDRVVLGAVTAAAALAERAPTVAPADVRPVLCLLRDDRVSGSSHGVTICSSSTLATTLLSAPERLTPVQVRRAVVGVEAVLRHGRHLAVVHG